MAIESELEANFPIQNMYVAFESLSSLSGLQGGTQNCKASWELTTALTFYHVKYVNDVTRYLDLVYAIHIKLIDVLIL